MSSIDVPLRKGGFGETRRTDNWWVEPLLIFLGYLAFILYANYAVFVPMCGANAQGAPQPCYEVPGTSYLSPMYSPLLFTSAPAWWPGFIPFSAAMLILWAPAGFRFTCYYYRGAYYKGWWADPPSCAVGEPRNAYRGEKKFPLIFQNVHRYFLYLAILFIFILSWDAWRSLWFAPAGNPDAPKTEFGIALGSLIMILNPILLGLYTFGCHSFRHLIAGRKDVMADAKLQKSCYNCVSALNRSHMKWAWISMFYVAFVDIYIRMCALGVVRDWRIL
ncbi:MAG TPA: hypothetical protein VGR73_07815 [Bryobacteraceae bacterium]|nr:hypothetical protein [Bryobacteraceae bacterium]